MYLIGSLIVAFVITLYLVSRIATMLNAKEPGMPRVFAASLVGSITASVAVIALGMFVQGLDPLVMLILTVSIMFFVSSMAFKYINIMSWGGAITTNIANIALSLIGVTAAVVLTGGSITDTLKLVNTGVSSTGIVPVSETAVEQVQEVALEEDFDDEVFREKDFLPPGTVKEMEAKNNKVIKAPRFRVVSINSIRSVVGKKIRIQNTNGNSITGALKNVVNNDAVIEQRMGGGVAITPISLSKITKLEVYR